MGLCLLNMVVFQLFPLKPAPKTPPSTNSKNKSSISLSLYTRAGPQRTPQASGIEALKGPSLALWVGGVRGDQVQPRDSGAPFGEGMGSACFGTPFWLGLKGNQFRRCPNRDTPVYCLRIRNAISARDRPIEIQQITHKKSETNREPPLPLARCPEETGNGKLGPTEAIRFYDQSTYRTYRWLASLWFPYHPKGTHTHTPPCHLQRPFSAEKQA